MNGPETQAHKDTALTESNKYESNSNFLTCAVDQASQVIYMQHWLLTKTMDCCISSADNH